MLMLTSRFVLPFYFVPIFYYFIKFFFIYTLVFTLIMMICSSATAALKIQNNTVKIRLKYEELKDYVKHGTHYTNTWVSVIEGGSNVVQKIAETHGYVVLTEIFPDTYHLLHPKVMKLSPHKEKLFSSRLASRPEVLSVTQQTLKRRVKRDFIMLPFPPSKSKIEGGDHSFREATVGRKLNSSQRGILSKSRGTFEKNDPRWPDMWYLNRGNERDMNVRGAWEDGYSGLGIVVTVLDDGLEKDHPDLVTNYDPQASYDINNHDEDPMPRYDSRDSNRHGTRCAGEIAAAANNNRCSVGVAFRASIGGIKMLDGDLSDAVEARALSLNPQHIDIYSVSWGPDDDGKTLDGPGELVMRAFIEGVTKGRGGKGSIFVWASGNGGREYDNCNCDGYTNSIYTLSVSSATEAGEVPWYSELCSAAIATTYSSGQTWEAQISTTDLHHDCTGNHTGTSASAPLAAGVIALVLEANTELTWRDMQHITIATARPNGLKANDWQVNGAGRRVSHSFGYGLMDATAMVTLAREWKRVGPQRVHETEAVKENIIIPGNGSKSVTLFISQSNQINHLEHVQARITLSAGTKRGDIKIALISPNGTKSILLTIRGRDDSKTGFQDWPFMTVHCWGEQPFGIWTLEIYNQGRYAARLTKWYLMLYGTESNPFAENSVPTTRTKSTTPRDKITQRPKYREKDDNEDEDEDVESAITLVRTQTAAAINNTPLGRTDKHFTNRSAKFGRDLSFVFFVCICIVLRG